MELKSGQKIRVKDSGDSVTVVKKLGEGGQGIVYEAEYLGNRYALKWFFPGKIKKPKEFRDNLCQNIADGPPTESFLWPILVTEQDGGSFGYLMKIRPGNYKSFTDILNAKIRIVKHSVRIKAALTIVESFFALHRQGKSYQDLNDGNFFIDPSSGDVLICDNDNVAPYGINLGIAGKCRYMAPEVVLGEKPGMQSDYFSLAVMLFLLLFLSHPLEGEKVIKSVCLTEKHERKHYGSDPVFIFDPQNDSNRPVRGVHNNAIALWPLYPAFIRDAFTTSFTAGIRSKEARISDSEWLKLFVRLRDEIITCGCGCENFACTNEISGTHYVRCLGCGAEMIQPLRMDIQKYTITLYPGNRLYECHITPGGTDFRTAAGEVIRNKKDRSLWGIRNLSGIAWRAQMPDGQTKSVAPGGVVPIFRGVTVDFGNRLRGEIH
jgi:serine/threonine protein kinase